MEKTASSLTPGRLTRPFAPQRRSLGVDETAQIALMEAREVILMEAACCHMGGTYHRREWSRVTGAVFFLCCGHTVSSSSLRLANVVSHHGYAIDQSSVDVEEMDLNFMMATLILFLETLWRLG